MNKKRRETVAARTAAASSVAEEVEAPKKAEVTPPKAEVTPPKKADVTFKDVPKKTPPPPPPGKSVTLATVGGGAGDGGQGEGGEATPKKTWKQPPGTPAAKHAFLNIAELGDGDKDTEEGEEDASDDSFTFSAP